MADCANCRDKECYSGKDCFDVGDETANLYKKDDFLARLHAEASKLEALFYSQKTRLEEIVELIKMMGLKRVGVAFCIGLSKEAETLVALLSDNTEAEIHSVCCKCGGISKDDLELPKIRQGKFEAICNPHGQAHLLGEAGCELNISVGLCVGHDAVFSKASEAPVVTFIAKDRVTGHNPVAALYVPYLRRRLQRKDGE